jgi:hypothetical protein
MNITSYIGSVRQKYGSDKMSGAMVFVNIDRPLDEMIRYALALDKYHLGKPSPWSHCFMISEPYKGGDTGILDCTI